MSGYRVLSHDDQKTLKILNAELKCVSEELDAIDYAIQAIDAHLLDRVKDRDIWIGETALVIKYVLKNKLCQLIFNCELDKEPFKKFEIVYDKSFIILCTCRTVRGNLRLIKFNSIIEYNPSQIYHNFKINVGKLVRKNG